MIDSGVVGLLACGASVAVSPFTGWTARAFSVVQVFAPVQRTGMKGLRDLVRMFLLQYFENPARFELHMSRTLLLRVSAAL